MDEGVALAFYLNLNNLTTAIMNVFGWQKNEEKKFSLDIWSFGLTPSQAVSPSC